MSGTPVISDGTGGATGRLRLLVAESNPADQMLIRGILTSLGHEVDLVDAGREVLGRLTVDFYDAVLMDCKLAGPNSCETTRRIRAGAGTDPRIRIIALAASIIPAERVACRAAGIDDFVGKPIQPVEIRAALDRVRPAVAAEPATPAKTTGGLLDQATLQTLRLLRGKNGPSLLPEALAMFARTAPTELQKLAQQAGVQDAAKVVYLAHSLAGSCASVGAQQMRRTLNGIERAAKTAEWPQVKRALVQLDEDCALTLAAFTAEIAGQARTERAEA